MDTKKYEVPLESLVWTADPREFTFSSTEQIPLPEDPIDIVKGQQDAKEILRGSIKKRQNILLLGPPGCGKSLLAKTVAEHYAKQKVNKIKVYDQLLVRNIDKENEPKVLQFPTPLGKEFALDYRMFMRLIRNGVPYGALFTQPNPLEQRLRFSKKKGLYTTTYNNTVKRLLEGAAAQTGYKLKENIADVLRQSSQGVLDTPVFVDENEKAYSLRDVYSPPYIFDESEEGEATAHRLQKMILQRIVKKYAGYPDVLQYLNASAKYFYETANAQDAQQQQLMIVSPQMARFEEEKYMANLLIDNSEINGIPVIFIENASLQSIIGDARHDPLDSEPEHMRVKAGKLHLAHGGIAIFDEIIF